MKTEHTPGPWQHDPVWHLIYGPNKVEIAAIHAAVDPREKRRVNMDTATANARLITAAPDLLETCKALLPHAVKLLEASEAIDGLTLSKVNLEWDIEHAQEAIAKAEGKE